MAHFTCCFGTGARKPDPRGSSGPGCAVACLWVDHHLHEAPNPPPPSWFPYRRREDAKSPARGLVRAGRSSHHTPCRTEGAPALPLTAWNPAFPCQDFAIFATIPYLLDWPVEPPSRARRPCKCACFAKTPAGCAKTIRTSPGKARTPANAAAPECPARPNNPSTADDPPLLPHGFEAENDH